MPFENTDSPEFSDNLDDFAHLSPKLVALAQQLSDDACMLQERYPAKAFDLDVRIGNGDQRPPHPNRRLLQLRAIRWPLIASSGAAAVLCAVMIWRGAALRLDRESDADSPAIVVLAAEELVTDSTGRIDHSGAQESRSTVDILRGLSAAEQEALLDLLEDNRGSKESVSI